MANRAAISFPEPLQIGRIWGVGGDHELLASWYGSGQADLPIGEVWLTERPCPVLVKTIFTAAPLSVQVHPDDAWAAARGLGRGKTEMWLVLAAEAGAQVGVGLRAGADPAEFGDACRGGRGAEMLAWHEVAPGDAIFIPAGTVHAIGAGLVLCEVQEYSDITFRLDDYGRRDAAGKMRELHLEDGLAVARLAPGDGLGGIVRHGLAAGEAGCLLSSPYFRVSRYFIDSAGVALAAQAAPAARVVINLGPGGLELAGHPLRPGHAAVAESAAEACRVVGSGGPTLGLEVLAPIEM